MNYSEFSKDIDKTSFGLIKKAAGMFVSQLLRPLTTVTDPFFKTKMGARYFDGFHWLGGIALWAFATWYDHQVSSFSGNVTSYLCYYQTSNWLDLHHYYWPGIVLTVLFAILGGVSVHANGKREKSGVIWHSMSRGKSLWGTENKDRDWFWTTVVVVLLFLFTPFCGLLFLVSRILSEMFSELERKRAYRRYLDVMDAQIEANFLESALLNGTPPTENYGLYGPLPEKYEGQHRENIARAGTGGDIELFERKIITEVTTANVASRRQHSIDSIATFPCGEAEPPVKSADNVQYKKMELPSNSLIQIVEFEFEGKQVKLRLEDLIDDYIVPQKQVTLKSPNQLIEAWLDSKTGHEIKKINLWEVVRDYSWTRKRV